MSLLSYFLSLVSSSDSSSDDELIFYLFVISLLSVLSVRLLFLNDISLDDLFVLFDLKFSNVCNIGSLAYSVGFYLSFSLPLLSLNPFGYFLPPFSSMISISFIRPLLRSEENYYNIVSYYFGSLSLF